MSFALFRYNFLFRRTADVRSVGYSELFSLSREDVLAAMKDYPEAQEILQALGRKRLMEVKASARHSTHHKEHHHGHNHGQDGKGLVDKIKSEAKVGLGERCTKRSVWLVFINTSGVAVPFEGL